MRTTALAICLGALVCTALPGCGALQRKVLVLSAEEAQRCKFLRSLEYDVVAKGHPTYSCRLLYEFEEVPVFRVALTWRDYDGLDDPEKARYFLGIGEVGSFLGVLHQLRSMPMGSQIHVYPSYHTRAPFPAWREKWPFSKYLRQFEAVAVERNLTILCTEFGPLRYLSPVKW